MTSAFIKVDARQDKFRKTYTFLSTKKTILGMGRLGSVTDALDLSTSCAWNTEQYNFYKAVKRFYSIQTPQGAT
jgi:hypothetical protein